MSVDRDTQLLRMFLATPLETSGPRFANANDVDPLTFNQIRKGKRFPQARRNLSTAERQQLDSRNPRKVGNSLTEADVTEELREYLRTAPGTSMRKFAEPKDYSQQTFMRWASGEQAPGGRKGLTDAERTELDERREALSTHTVYTIGKTVEELRAFLSTAPGTSVHKFTKDKPYNPDVFERWASGTNKPQARAQLSVPEQVDLDKRRVSASAAAGVYLMSMAAVPGSSPGDPVEAGRVAAEQAVEASLEAGPWTLDELKQAQQSLRDRAGNDGRGGTEGEEEPPFERGQREYSEEFQEDYRYFSDEYRKLQESGDVWSFSAQVAFGNMMEAGQRYVQGRSVLDCRDEPLVRIAKFVAARRPDLADLLRGCGYARIRVGNDWQRHRCATADRSGPGCAGVMR